MKPTFAHIINIVSPADNAELAKVQAQTIATIRAAHAQAAGKINVELFTAQFADARAHVPEGFRATTDLRESAAGRPELGTKKRLPLLREILSRFEETSATHCIYTNLDICLMPFFYGTVAQYVESGHDAIVINRRRISGKLLGESPEKLYAEAGETHTGYDCFIFSRELLKKFVMKDVFIGTPPSGNDLFYSLFVFAENPVLLTQKHLTFHTGMELVKPWGDPKLNAHNQNEFRKLLRELKPSIDIAKFPGAGYGFFKRHFKWLMNPTFHYPTMASVDFKQLGRPRRKPAKKEMQGSSGYLEWLIRKVNFRDGD